MSTGFLVFHVKHLGMGDSNDRLKEARIAAKFASSRQAAIRLGWNPSTYASHENGQTPVPSDAAKIYARAFRVKPEWIVFGVNSAQTTEVRVMGQIGAGAKIDPDAEQVPEEGLSEVGLPFPVSSDAIAFEVSGPSMKPRLNPGDIVVCSNREMDPLKFIGNEVAVKTASGHRYLKILRQGTKRGLFHLESFNDDIIRDQAIDWIGEILAIVPANKARTITGPKSRTRG